MRSSTGTAERSEEEDEEEELSGEVETKAADEEEADEVARGCLVPRSDCCGWSAASDGSPTVKDGSRESGSKEAFKESGVADADDDGEGEDTTTEFVSGSETEDEADSESVVSVPIAGACDTTTFSGPRTAVADGSATCWA